MFIELPTRYASSLFFEELIIDINAVDSFLSLR